MKRLIMLLFLSIVFSCMTAYSASGIGKIISIKGEVKIDILGTGTFKAAREHDTIYMKTVIKTGNQGKAVVTIREKDIILYAGSQVRGEELYWETKLSGFEELKNIFYHSCISFLAFLFPKEDIKPSGFKDVNAVERIDKEITWQGIDSSEQETPATYALAIVEKDYATALILLDEHRELSVPAKDVRLFKGFCYFQLRYYKEAYDIFSNVKLSIEQNSPKDKEKYGFYNAILFQKCLAAFFTGEEDAAKKQLAELMKVSMDETLAAGLRELGQVLQKESDVQ